MLVGAPSGVAQRGQKIAQSLLKLLNDGRADDLSRCVQRGLAPKKDHGAMLETFVSAGKGRGVKEGCTFPVTES